MRQLLEDRWPHVTFTVTHCAEPAGNNWSVKVHWTDGPLSGDVKAAVRGVWPHLEVVVTNEVSLRTVALGVLLDYRAAADGAINLHSPWMSWRDGVPLQGLLHLADPWETHEDRALAELAQTLADVAVPRERQDILGCMAFIAQVLVDLGGLAGLRQLHDGCDGPATTVDGPAR